MSSRSNDASLRQARRKAGKLGLDRSQFTLIVCMDRKTGKCCGGREMNDTWRRLKDRSKQWRKSGNAPIFRIKAGCIGVCKSGPIIGVMPDGVWYGACTPEVVDRIFDEHLSEGKLLKEHLIAQGIESNSN